MAYFIWFTARYTVRQTLVPRNATRSTKLQEAQRAPELSFSRSPESLIFLALLVP